MAFLVKQYLNTHEPYEYLTKIAKTRISILVLVIIQSASLFFYLNSL